MKRKIALFVFIVSLSSPLRAEENAIMIETISTFIPMVLFEGIAINISYEKAINRYFSFAPGLIYIDSLIKYPTTFWNNAFVINPFLNLRFYPGGRAIVGFFLEVNVNYSFWRTRKRDYDETTKQYIDSYTEMTGHILYFGATIGRKVVLRNGYPLEVSAGTSLVTDLHSTGMPDDYTNLFFSLAPKLTFSFGWLW